MGKIYRLLTALFGFLLLSFSGFSGTQVLVSVYYGGFGSECSWEIREKTTNQVVLSGGPGGDNSYSYNGSLILNGGQYQFIAFDAGGNGWTQPDGWFQATPLLGEGTSQVFFLTGSSLTTEFSVFTNTGPDPGFLNLLSPVTAPGLGSESLSLRIRNFGNQATNGLTVSYSLNGQATVQNSFPILLQPGQTCDVTFPTAVNLSAVGDYSFSFSLFSFGDQYAGNNVFTQVVTNLNFIGLFPHFQEFSVWPPPGWQLTGGSQNWQWHTSGAVYCAFFNWQNGQNALLTSPAFQINQPLFLSFDWARAANSQPDQLQVQVSQNNGLSWTTLWTKSGSALSTPGGTNTSPGQYQSEVIDLSSFQGQYIWLRLAGTSGFGSFLFLDNLGIQAYPPVDVSLHELMSPDLNSCTGGLQPVVVRVKNLGTNPVSSVVAGYILSQTDTIFSDTFQVNLGLNGQADLNLGNAYAFTGGQWVDFKAFVHCPGDVDVSNDVLDTSYWAVEPIHQFPFFETFGGPSSSFFKLDQGLKAKAAFVGSQANGMIEFQGDSTGVGWNGTASNTSATQAWVQNFPFHSRALSCEVHAVGLSSLQLKFNLRQTFVYGSKYSWFRVLVNNNPIPDSEGITDHHPLTSSGDPFQTLVYDLSAYAGTNFQLTFQGSNKWDSISRPPGNTAFLDDILLRQIPPPDLVLEEVQWPASACEFPDSTTLSIRVRNAGGYPISNFSIESQINNSSADLLSLSVSLPPDSAAWINLPVAFDFSINGSYYLILNLLYPTDTNTANNTGSHFFENFAPMPVSFTGIPGLICANQAAFPVEAYPPGGVFSGPGMEAGLFSPAGVGVGSHLISYAGSDSNACSTSGDTLLTVNPFPQPTLGPDVIMNQWDTLAISAGPGYASWLWSNGFTGDTLWMFGLTQGPGLYSPWVQASDSLGCQGTDTLNIQVLHNAFQQLNLPNGWGIMSLNINPFQSNIAQVFGPILANLVLAKDMTGKVFWPLFNINTIGSMVLGLGYQTRIIGNQNLIVDGIPVVPENEIITVHSGWNLIGYLRQSNGPISQMLAPNLGFIVLVKDGNGMIYWPSLNVNTIGSMVPGRGYLLKSSGVFNLTYPPN